MTPEIKTRYANVSVPRYTSYPTAPHFNAQVGPVEAADWLGQIAPQDAVSLYLHVPYCQAICHYCGCHTKATLRDGPLLAYAETLAAEMAIVAGSIGRRQAVSHIHWGGGTPSLMPGDRLLALVADIKQHFDVQPGTEHAIELDPRTVTEALATTLAEAGINRASLGVQDFDLRVQEAIGRVQPFAVVEAAVQRLRAVGIEAINFDLMYGLPHQSVATMRATVEQAVALAPGRIALFGYAHVPWFKKHQRLIDEAALPDAAGRLDLEAAARAELADAGYVAVGLDHFAEAPDQLTMAANDQTLRRNFQGYTTDTAETLIGLGVSSIGKLPGGFVQNALDVTQWRQRIEAGELPTIKGKALDLDDRLRAAVIERLMCDYAVDLQAICDGFSVPVDTLADGFEALQGLIADGLATLSGAQVRVTEAGRPFVRVVAAAFDAYLPRALARHSMAV